MKLQNLKIALVFDWLTTAGGAERVNLHLHHLFPDAPIYTSIYTPQKVKGFASANIHTSFIQKLPLAKKKHQLYLNLMPYAYESFDLSKYDIVISSSHSCAKGIITKPETLHISYCHNPMRYAWHTWHNYIDQYNLPNFIKKIGKRKIHNIRLWDRLSAERVDHFIANSHTVQKRIKKYYQKDSTVITPSIDLSQFTPTKNKEEFYLVVSRLTASKKIDLVVDTFNKSGQQLKIIGSGVDRSRLQNKAKSNIQFLGYLPDQQVREQYSKAKALIFPQEEDFGITPLEAMASGTPVIAYKKGGALETVKENLTGIFFPKQTSQSLLQAIEKFQKHQFTQTQILQHAQKFDHKHFNTKILTFIQDKWENWQKTTK